MKKAIYFAVPLFLVVPLTTLIAIFFALSVDSLGWARQFLGPEGSGEGHPHSH